MKDLSIQSLHPEAETLAQLLVTACHDADKERGEFVFWFGRFTFPWLEDGETISVVVTRHKPALVYAHPYSAAEMLMPERV